MNVTNYHVAFSGTTGGTLEILRGVDNSTVIKSLEIIAPTTTDAMVVVYRIDPDDSIYGSIKLDLETANYVMLWEGFIAIPAGHRLCIDSDVSGVEAVANVVEL